MGGKPLASPFLRVYYVRGRWVMVVEGRCDCCVNPAERVLDSSTSEECAWWFKGHYCVPCFQLVEEGMRAENHRAKPQGLGGVGCR